MESEYEAIQMETMLYMLETTLSLRTTALAHGQREKEVMLGMAFLRWINIHLLTVVDCGQG